MKAVLITSSILIVLIAALRPLLRGKIAPKAQYGLWLVVGLRLLIPVNLFTSAYSALALLERAEEPPQLVQTIGQTSIPVQSYDSARAEAVRELEQRGVPEADFTPADLTAIDQQARELMRGPTVGEVAQKLAKPVWLTGAALMAGWFLLVNAGLRRKLRGGSRLEVVDCPLPVYVSDALPSPCLCGIFRPAIYVTPAALDSPDRLRHVLAHELTHHRHRDHWWAVLRCLCLCLYWFDPLVWWAAALSRQDCELACDEGAIRALGEGERIPYGRTLVAMIAAGRNPLLQTATTMTGGKRRVRERVKLIARRPKTVLAVALALAVIIACAVGCTFTGAPEASPEPDPTPSASPAPDAPRPTLDTLQDRLRDVPEELRDEVVVYYPDYEKLGVAPPKSSNFLATYQLDAPDPGMSNWLLTICQWNQADFEEWLYYTETGTYDVFARDSESYYATMRPTSVEVEEKDYERWGAAQQAIGKYARQQVLDTQGVTPYDPSDLREREYLWEGKTYTDVAYWPYKNINGDTDIVWILRLVQLAKDGPGGVWIPERYQIIDRKHGFDPTPQHTRPVEAVGIGLTVTEYAAQLQAEADAGDADWATDPIQVCMHFAETGFVHSSVTADCFTWDSAYIESALERLQPSEEQKAIQAVMDAIIDADGISLSLAPGGTSRVYAYAIPGLDEWDETEGYYAYRLENFAQDFQWEEFDWGTTEDPHFPPTPQERPSLRVNLPNNSVYICAWEDSDVVAVHDASGTNWYQAVSNRYGDPLGSSFWNPSPYGSLRMWFDNVELSFLRTDSVPDRGQSHETVVLEWIEGFDGAFTKCAPGSQYACTDVWARDIQTDVHSFMSKEDMDEFAESRGQIGDDYGKTWFTFSYSLVFVPENENAKQHFLAGNTVDYTGDGAPEGAQIFSRVAYMNLIDGNWVCKGTGTGW